MIRLTRRYRFAASHRLHAPSLSEERNREVYGKCNNPHGHGHDYVLEVSVRGPVDPETGMVVRVDALDALVQREVLTGFHMRNINMDVPEFASLVATSENVASVVQARLQNAWERAFPAPWPVLEKVRIQETARNILEVYAHRDAGKPAEPAREMAMKS